VFAFHFVCAACGDFTRFSELRPVAFTGLAGVLVFQYTNHGTDTFHHGYKKVNNNTCVCFYRWQTHIMNYPVEICKVSQDKVDEQVRRMEEDRQRRRIEEQDEETRRQLTNTAVLISLGII
jgi:hypothetical protein